MSTESLSALFDGQCGDAELNRLLDQMDSSPELARRWGRWQLTRELQEGTRYSAGQTCICASVMAALEEPVRHGAVVDLAAWRRRVVALPWKPMVGFAAAASMGAAAVLFLVPVRGTAGPEGSSAVSGMSPGIRVSNPLALPGTRAMGRLQSVSLNGDGPGPTFADEEYTELLHDYIASRNGNSYSDQGGTLRYARYSHAGDSRPATEVDAKR